MGLFGPKANKKGLGERSEAVITYRLLEAGYNVLKPYGDNTRYDLVIEDADGRFWKVQCKTTWMSPDNNCIIFATASNESRIKDGRWGYGRKSYRGEIHYFAAYSPHTDKVYLVPVDHVGTTNAYLRLVETENKQKKGVHWARDYEL
jgi:hypothetical protein